MIEKIKDLLKQYNRNIIFYFDADGSFKEELNAITLEGFKVVQVKDNYFEIKHNIEFEWTKEQLFLYHPFEKPQGKALKKYPLLGLLKANPELRLDATSEFLTEYQLSENHVTIVKRYIDLLKTKTIKKKLVKILDPTVFTDDNIKLGLISITLDFHSVANRNSCMVKNHEEYLEDSKSNFEELAQNVESIGVNLTYRFENLHDRFIAADNGWKITLGRGLDMFEKIEEKFSVADIDQTRRKCKSCELTYLKI